MQALIKRLRGLPQGLQFIFVGGCAAAVHLAVVGLLVQFAGMQPLQANVLAFLVAFVVSYNGHVLLTFSRAGVHGRAALLRYFTVACAAFAANELLYWLALDQLRWHYFWSQALVLVLVALGTFVSAKLWAFSAPGRKEAG
ncbi:GtrA family protein [Comamonas composti]|uniref:GtrA family protein n=1 Tax=Comamonas composti TaxID=408558 RepID=UPI0004260BA4|nr:GtrA family protein [Comamonas composti]